MRFNRHSSGPKTVSCVATGDRPARGEVDEPARRPHRPSRPLADQRGPPEGPHRAGEGLGAGDAAGADEDRRAAAGRGGPSRPRRCPPAPRSTRSRPGSCAALCRRRANRRPRSTRSRLRGIENPPPHQRKSTIQPRAPARSKDVQRRAQLRGLLVRRREPVDPEQADRAGQGVRADPRRRRAARLHHPRPAVLVAHGEPVRRAGPPVEQRHRLGAPEVSAGVAVDGQHLLTAPEPRPLGGPARQRVGHRQGRRVRQDEAEVAPRAGRRGLQHPWTWRGRCARPGGGRAAPGGRPPGGRRGRAGRPRGAPGPGRRSACTAAAVSGSGG